MPHRNASAVVGSGQGVNGAVAIRSSDDGIQPLLFESHQYSLWEHFCSFVTSFRAVCILTRFTNTTYILLKVATCNYAHIEEIILFQ